MPRLAESHGKEAGVELGASFEGEAISDEVCTLTTRKVSSAVAASSTMEAEAADAVPASRRSLASEKSAKSEKSSQAAAATHKSSWKHKWRKRERRPGESGSKDAKDLRLTLLEREVRTRSVEVVSLA